MQDNKNDLGHYFDKLEEVFPSSEMTPAARDASIFSFTEYVRENRLSLEAAITALADPALVKLHTQIGERSVVLQEQAQTERAKTKSNDDIRSDVGSIKEVLGEVRDVSGQVATIASATYKILSNIAEMAKETHAATARNESLLGQVDTAAGELKGDMEHAVSAIRGIVQDSARISQRLEKVAERVEAIEGSVGLVGGEVKEVKGFTHPTATRKENIKMLGHSIFWGSIVSTIMGTAASIGISHLGKEKPADPPKPQAPKVIERILVEPPQPKTFVLHDPKGKTYTLNVDPSPASKPHRPPHHHHHRKVAGHRPKNP